MKPTKRSDALRLGVTRYYTGKPCKHGHIADRLASCGRCWQCHKINRINFFKTELGRQMKRRWDRKNIHKRRMRAKEKLNAIPKWADIKAISKFYRDCPDGHHVDHIIPLNNPDICGLHSIENLQYLPAEENLKKGNSVETVALDAVVCPIKV
jgi:hypothetical protein